MWERLACSPLVQKHLPEGWRQAQIQCWVWGCACWQGEGCCSGRVCHLCPYVGMMSPLVTKTRHFSDFHSYSPVSAKSPCLWDSSMCVLPAVMPCFIHFATQLCPNHTGLLFVFKTLRLILPHDLCTWVLLSGTSPQISNRRSLADTFLTFCASVKYHFPCTP